jgi:hypothetical protein
MALSYAQIIRGIELILADRGKSLSGNGGAIKISSTAIQYWDASVLGAQPTIGELEARVIQETKAELYASLSEARYNLQNAGLAIPGVGTVRTDRDVINDMDNAKEYLRLKILADQAKDPADQEGLTEETATVRYKIASGQPRVVANIPLFEQLGVAIGDYWQACFLKEEEVEQAITDSNDLDFLESMKPIVASFSLSTVVPESEPEEPAP